MSTVQSVQPNQGMIRQMSLGAAGDRVEILIYCYETPHLDMYKPVILTHDPLFTRNQAIKAAYEYAREENNVEAQAVLTAMLLGSKSE